MTPDTDARTCDFSPGLRASAFWDVNYVRVEYGVPGSLVGVKCSFNEVSEYNA